MIEVADSTARETHQMSHIDVLIAGAGISGIDAAYHLQKAMPERIFKMLDALDDFGGTWRSHTYPGIRSDCDLFTVGLGGSLGPDLQSLPLKRSSLIWQR